jgi:hypothetical protein
MDVIVAVEGPDGPDELRSLGTWLTGEEELRGRVRPAGSGARPGALGPLAETLVVALGPGSLATALASGLVTWLRHRTGDVMIKAQRPDGQTAELSAKRVHGMSSAQVRELVGELAGMLGEAAGEPGEAGRDPDG